MKNDNSIQQTIPCPFCGDNPEIQRWANDGAFMEYCVMCSNGDCPAENVDVICYLDDEKKAVEIWNKRSYAFILKPLNERRNKLVLQNADHVRVEGFDLAIDLIKSLLNSDIQINGASQQEMIKEQNPDKTNPNEPNSLNP